MKTIIHENVTVGENGHLHFAGFDTIDLAKKYGTPAILLDEDRVRAHMREYKTALETNFGAGSMPLLASKAFSCKAIYRIAAEEGIGTDIVSPGELYTAAAAGFPMERAFFHGNNKTDSDIRYAMESGLGYFVVDHLGELDAIDAIAGEMGITQRILLRITPGIDPHTHQKISTGGVDSKFGSAIETGLAEKITAEALKKPHVALEGFHCHIGSQIFEIDPFVTAVEIMTAFIAEMREKLGFTAKILNLGGGIGVRYVESDPVISVTENVNKICAHIKACTAKHGLPALTIYMEPGRSIVADAGMTLYTVGSVKELEGFKNYVSIDGGMTDNPRYTLYQSAYTVLLANDPQGTSEKTYTIGGRCCESGDLIQENVPLPSPKKGDTLAVLVTGAYNYSMASNYNRIPRPPVVLLANGCDKIAVRRETFEDLIRCDV